MKKSVFLIVLGTFLLAYLLAKQPNELTDYQTPYREALAIFSAENTSNAQDSIAIQKFEEVIAILEKNPQNEAVLLDCYQKAGSLYIAFDKQATANTCFNKIIAIAGNKKGADSILFAAYLYSGRTYYSISNFDSAHTQYKKAEAILEKFPEKSAGLESERLYNMLGVLYYDYGNYKDAINYFNKALALLAFSGNNKANLDLYQNYKLNIISCFIKLHLYTEANFECIALGKTSSQNKILENALHFKNAEINIGLKDYESALSGIRQVQYSDRNLLKVYNTYANIFNGLLEFDSATRYIQKAMQANSRFYNSNQNFDLAVSFMHWGTTLAKQKDYAGSVAKYQIAISKLLLNFKDTGIYANPEKFSGTFSASTLLDCLIAKAAVFYQWYLNSKNSTYLKASLDAYNAVFALASYMETSYTSDEAVLFLAERKLEIHNAPIRICLQLFNLTKDFHYFESALLFDEQNKNTVLNKANGERQLVLESKIPAAILENEQKIKNNITILSLKLTNLTDTVAIKDITGKINDAAIALAKLKETKRTFEPQKTKESNVINLKLLQQKLKPGNGILSYHVMDTGLVGFLITKNSFLYKSIAVDALFFANLHNFAGYLKEPVPENDPDALNRYLYEKLITPFVPFFNDIQAIAIFPDDDLHVLPFEVLRNGSGTLLCQQFSINYITSYKNIFLPAHFNLAGEKILAFAPFTRTGNNGYNQLDASAYEVEQLNGTVVVDSFATKTFFKNKISGYPVIHLATHAKVNDSFPEISHIVFYNKGIISDTGLLYRDEIANLDLSATKLVFLSACATGAGKLIKGEGLMSLSRSFAYAGCPNIITSLWQADDNSTATITNKFYTYLAKKYPAGKALQLAKLDYLNDPAIAKNKKTPYYWAHLIYIGQIESTSGNWLKPFLFWVVGFCVFVLGFFFIKNWIRKSGT